MVFRFRFPRCFQPVATALFRKDLNPNFLIKALFLSPYYHRFSEMSTPKKRVFHINFSLSIIIDSKMSIYAYNLRRGDTLALGKQHCGANNTVCAQSKRHVARGFKRLCGHRAHAFDDDRVRDKAGEFLDDMQIAEAFDMRPSELVRKMEEAEEKRDK